MRAPAPERCDTVRAVDALRELFGQDGRVALVVGASSGLGAEAAEALAKAGASVGLVARRAERLLEVAARLEARGAKVCVAPADATLAEEIAAAVDRVERALGPVDVLVYAAGVAPLGRAERHTAEKWQAAIEVNLTGAFRTAQEVGRRMIERGRGGRIVFVSSVLARGASPVHRCVGYVASKGGLDALTRQLAVEWAPHGITVNAVAPAYFPTEMTRDARTGEVPPDQRARMETFTPLGRLGRPGELETAILFLAAPASTYVTGAVVPVDGGWTAW